MKFFMKVLVLPFLVALCLMGGKGETVQAAYTTDGTYYPDLWTEVDWGEYEEYKEIIKERNKYVVLHFCEVPSTGYCVYYYSLSNAPNVATEHINDMGNIYQVVEAQDCIGVSPTDGSIVSFSMDFNTGSAIMYDKLYQTGEDSNVTIIGSNYDYRNDVLMSWPYSNLDYVPSVHTTSVSIVVDGVEYIIEEPYPYYFISYGYDNIRLYFSEMPFTATPFDTWLRLIPNADYPEVVSYEWDSSFDVGFSESRTVDSSGHAIAYNSSVDYACNYTLYYTGSLGEIALLPKDTYPDVYELYASLPDELTAFTYYIILRQIHENAVTSDVVFYGWNDANADLIIRWGDSMIAAAKKGTVVSDSIKARYDLASKSWVVDSSVSIGTCYKSTYNVPYIYYSNSDLFIQQSGQTGWYTSGICAYMADLDAPNIWFEEEEPEEITGIEWLDGLLSGLGNLFSRLFVPSSSFIQQKVTNLTTRFSFWRSVVNTVGEFVTFLSETDFTEPPQVSLNLGSAISKYDYGTSAYFIDFTWYEPYKSDVDVLVSAVLWVVFVWNTFKNLPNTIRGVSGGLVSTASHLSTKEGE